MNCVEYMYVQYMILYGYCYVGCRKGGDWGSGLHIDNMYTYIGEIESGKQATGGEVL